MVALLAAMVAGGAFGLSWILRVRDQQALVEAVELLGAEGTLIHVSSVNSPAELFISPNASEASIRAICAARLVVSVGMAGPPAPEIREIISQHFRRIPPHPVDATTVAYPAAEAYWRRDVEYHNGGNHLRTLAP